MTEEVNVAVDAAIKDVAEETVENAVTEDDDAQDPQDGQQADDGEPSGDVEGELKTVRKALDKRNRYINNQRQRIRDLEAQMQKMQEGFGKNTAQAPDMDKFESVLDYVKADQNHALEQKFAEMQHKQKLELLEQQKAVALEEQTRVIEQQVTELAQSNPDFKKVVSANVQIFQAMPDHINGLLTELDNGHIAAYALAREGRLQDIYHMPPHIAAAHLVNAEIRGQQYLLQAAKPKKSAPEPIGSIKGSKSSTTSLSDMSADQLDKWRKS